MLLKGSGASQTIPSRRQPGRTGNAQYQQGCHAAARQAYLIRETLVQPLFDDRVVLAARAVPLADRISGALSAAV